MPFISTQNCPKMVENSHFQPRKFTARIHPDGGFRLKSVNYEGNSLFKKRMTGGQLIPDVKSLAQKGNWEKHRLLTYLVPVHIVSGPLTQSTKGQRRNTEFWKETSTPAGTQVNDEPPSPGRPRETVKRPSVPAWAKRTYLWTYSLIQVIAAHKGSGLRAA